MELISLANKYKTDKLDHGYIPFYEQFLPKNPKRILEIGVKEGRSLAMWAEYFPEAEIHGLDLFEENHMWDVETSLIQFGINTLNITQHKGNQCDWRVLEELRKYDFDVIIDDGSHVSRHQLMSFFGLYNGNHYFIEDLHCADEEFYRDGLPFNVTAKKIFNNGIYAVNNKIVLIHA